MKYVKSINLDTQREGIYQRGQTAKDAFKNLHVFQGIGKDGLNVWLETMRFNQLTGTYKERFSRLTGKSSQGHINELRRAKRQLRRIVKLESSFGKGRYDFGKDIRQQYWLRNDKGV
jgi:hypothetical protein